MDSRLWNSVVNITILLTILLVSEAGTSSTFPKRHYEFNVVEDVPIGTQFGGVSVLESSTTDPVRYHIIGDNSNIFAIDERRGILKTKTQLDREVKSRYYFNVQATDSASNSTTEVIVNLLDLNDNFPVFQHNKYRAVVMINAPIGTVVTHVMATDVDTGGNGEVKYRISSNPYENYFFIDAKTGSITLKQSLRGITNVTEIDIPVAANDGGVPPMTAIAVVTITIRNPDLPTDTAQNVTFHVLENQPPHTRVGRLNIIPGTVYEIGGRAPFVVDKTDGSLFTTATLDRESMPMYHFKIHTLDVNMNDVYDVMVFVDDENDNVPVFSQSSYTANIISNIQVGSSVLRVVAYDEDVGNDLRYTIAHKTDFLPFTVNSKTGMVSVVKPVLGDNYDFEISVSDGLYFNVALVHIVVV